jgi:inorganic pyrophosphatase
MHPWHDCYLDEQSVERSFPVVIEVPTGSTNKYERDLEHKQVVVEDMLGPIDALRILRESLDLYRQLRRGELKRLGAN